MKAMEIPNLEKGIQAEVQGQVTFSMEPRQYGEKISQFVVVTDETGKIGCNVSLKSKEDKLVNGNNVHIKGVVDKYPDKKNPNPDGSLPIATSIKGYVVEETVDAEDFPYGANVVGDPIKEMTKAIPSVMPTSKPTLPAKTERKPVELRNQQPTQKYMSQNDYWREKSFRDIDNNKKIVRECAIKAVTETVARNNPFGIKTKEEYFKFSDEIVAYINEEKSEEEKVTDRDLILSGAKSKAEIIAYINNARKGTPYENDAEFYVGLGCQILTHQTKKDLIETVEKFEELLGGK